MVLSKSQNLSCVSGTNIIVEGFINKSKCVMLWKSFKEGNIDLKLQQHSTDTQVQGGEGKKFFSSKREEVKVFLNHCEFVCA